MTVQTVNCSTHHLFLKTFFGLDQTDILCVLLKFP